MSDGSLTASQVSDSGRLVEEWSLDTGRLEVTPGESRAGEGAYRYLAEHPGVGSVTDLSRGGPDAARFADAPLVFHCP